METGPGRKQKEAKGAPEKTEFKCDFPYYRSAVSRTTKRQNDKNVMNRIAEIRQSWFHPVVRLPVLLLYLGRGATLLGNHSEGRERRRARISGDKQNGKNFGLFSSVAKPEAA